MVKKYNTYYPGTNKAEKLSKKQIKVLIKLAGKKGHSHKAAAKLIKKAASTPAMGFSESFDNATMIPNSRQKTLPRGMHPYGKGSTAYDTPEDKARIEGLNSAQNSAISNFITKKPSGSSYVDSVKNFTNTINSTNGQYDIGGGTSYTVPHMGCNAKRRLAKHMHKISTPGMGVQNKMYKFSNPSMGLPRTARRSTPAMGYFGALAGAAVGKKVGGWVGSAGRVFGKKSEKYGRKFGEYAGGVVGGGLGAVYTPI